MDIGSDRLLARVWWSLVNASIRTSEPPAENGPFALRLSVEGAVPSGARVELIKGVIDGTVSASPGAPGRRPTSRPFASVSAVTSAQHRKWFSVLSKKHREPSWGRPKGRWD